MSHHYQLVGLVYYLNRSAVVEIHWDSSVREEMFKPDSCGQVQPAAILGIQEQSHTQKAITRTFCPVVFPKST